MGETINVFAPATVANVGCGFDILGFAVEKLGDRLSIKKNMNGKLLIDRISGYANTISTDPKKNTAGVAILEMCKVLEISPGFTIQIEKLSPIGSGLGSSASSATAAVFALNILLGNPFPNRMDLLPFALAGEATSSGSFHADNVTPSLLGGFLAILSVKPLQVIQIPIPKGLKIILIHPYLEVLTKEARALIPKMVPLEKVTHQMENLIGFIMGMVNQDYSLMNKSFFDHLAVPFRAPLIPGFYEVQKAALDHGAIVCSISGSGPTVFALTSAENNFEKISSAMKSEFLRFGVESECFYSGFNMEGAIQI
jgi:homoserine kinase